MDGWQTTFLLGRPIFRSYVTLREDNLRWQMREFQFSSIFQLCLALILWTFVLSPRQVKTLHQDRWRIRINESTVTLLNRHVLPNLVLKCAEWCTFSPNGCTKKTWCFQKPLSTQKKETVCFCAVHHVLPGRSHVLQTISHGWSIAGLFQGFLCYRGFLLCCGSIFTRCFVDVLVGGKTIGNKAVIAESEFAITIDIRDVSQRLGIIT